MRTTGHIIIRKSTILISQRQGRKPYLVHTLIEYKMSSYLYVNDENFFLEFLSRFWIDSMKSVLESSVSIIKKREKTNRIPRTFRLKPELVEKLSQIAKQTGENRTYVLESLLEYAIEAYEKEKEKKSNK